MSFSLDVKNEVINIINNKNCAISELYAYFNFITKKDSNFIIFYSENENLLKKCQSLIKYLFSEEINILQSKNKYLELIITDKLLINKIINNFNNFNKNSLSCKRSYIRGAFICTGYITNPNKYYHLEFSNLNIEQAEILKNMLLSFKINAKIIQKKEHYILYIKEGEQIVDLLNIIEAHKSLLNLENIRVFKEVRNNINRIVNCETANLNKVVLNAIKQKEDIEFIQEKVGLNFLPKQLKEIAYLRLNYPDASLKELSEMIEPSISKSGVNHRLKKINKIAEDLRRH